MEQPFEEIAAPLGQEVWNDDALLDAFERAVSTHGLDKKDKNTQTQKEQSGKKKSTIIFKRNPVQEQEEESDDDMEAFVASQKSQPKPKEVKPTNSPKPTPVYTQPCPQPQAQSIPMNPSSMIPSIPDMEEQEALSQLLLAWYQAGYAAGRYASIRQRKLFPVSTNKQFHYAT